MIKINRHPTDRQLRQFGIALLTFGVVLATLLWYRGWGVAAAVGVGVGLALSAAVGYLFLPWMRLLYLGISTLTYPIGWVVSHVLLAIVYYGVLTPIGLILQLKGDRLRRRPDPSATSYWSPLPDNDDPGRYFRQF